MYPRGIFHSEREDLLGKFVQMDEGKSIRKRNRSVSDSKTGICGDSWSLPPWMDISHTKRGPTC